MPKTDKKKVKCPYCKDYTRRPETVRKHIALAHPQIKARKKQMKIKKAK